MTCTILFDSLPVSPPHQGFRMAKRRVALAAQHPRQFGHAGEVLDPQRRQHGKSLARSLADVLASDKSFLP